MADDPKLSIDRMLDAALALSRNESYRRTMDAVEGNAAQALDPSLGAPPRYLYVLAGDRREGPYAPAEVAERIRKGEIGPDTYLWKQGMTDWLPAREMTEFAQLCDHRTLQNEPEK